MFRVRDRDPLWKSVWRIIKKLQLDLPCGLAVVLLGNTQRSVTEHTRETPACPCTSMFTAALFTRAKL
jgi:hypothetical protein